MANSFTIYYGELLAYTSNPRYPHRAEIQDATQQNFLTYCSLHLYLDVDVHAYRMCITING